MLQEFKDFINKGNVVELAVAVIMATAFAPVVTSLVDGVFMQIISAIVGEPNFDGVVIPLGDTDLFIGTFITAVINFLIIAAAVFLVVKAYNQFRKQEEAAPEAPAPDVVLLAEIRDLLRSR